MERYLVYDSGCAACSRLAETVEQATAGKLVAISSRGEQAKELLDRAYPGGWQHAPYLVTVDQGAVRAYSGTPAALRLGLLMGPSKALRVWRTAQQSGAAVPGGEVYNASRRRFLQAGAAVAAAIGLASLLDLGTAGQVNAQNCPPPPFCGGCEFCNTGIPVCYNDGECPPSSYCDNAYYQYVSCTDCCGNFCSGGDYFYCGTCCPGPPP